VVFSSAEVKKREERAKRQMPDQQTLQIRQLPQDSNQETNNTVCNKEKKTKTYWLIPTCIAHTTLSALRVMQGDVFFYLRCGSWQLDNST